MSLRYPGGLITKSPTAPTTSAAKGVWTLEQALQYIKAGTWPLSALGDPYFQYNSILLPGQGTNGAQNNTFLDSSTNNFTITRNGNTTQGTFTPFSQTGWGNYFDGSSYLQNTSISTNLQIGTNNFTVEFWVYPTTAQASQTYGTVMSIGTNATGASYYELLNNGSGMNFRFESQSVSYTSTTLLNPNQWYHIAVVRSSTSTNGLKFYINGTNTDTFTVADNFSNYSTLVIGSSISNIGVRYLSGYVSNLRVVIGTAVYTGNFTPSTTPLTAISGTQLLTCQSNRFVDNSANAYNVAATVSGTPSVQAFSPFAPTASYSTSTVGGSGYFDGSGDYLTTPSSSQFAPAGDFTIGVWFYPTSLAAAYSAPLGNFTGNNSTDWLIEVTSAGVLNIYTNGTTVRIASSSGAIKANQWQYIAICRSGSTITGYLNGTSVGTYSQSGTFGSASKAIGIGARPDAQELVTGYISSVILLDGTVTTTVPSAPSTAVSGTSLLCNFTNGGITDATAKNDLETVGNASISTTQSKFGGSSISFNGTTDYLKFPNNPLYALGSSDFTIEAWIYTAAAATTQTICAKETSNSNSYLFHIANSTGNKLAINLASSSTGYSLTLTGSTTLSTNTWYYVAVTRSGSGTNNIKLYVNGTLDGQGTFSGTVYNDTSSFTVGYRQSSSNLFFNGYIDEFRFTLGYARTITTPTAAFPTQ